MSSSVRLFRWSAMAWIVAYALSILLLGEMGWVSAPVQLSQGGGLLQGFGELIAAMPRSVCVSIVGCTAVVAVLFAWTPHWTIGLVVWFLFRLVSHRMWLASNGGIQLMENMLLWLALMHVRTGTVIGPAALWIGRLQLLLVYAAAAAHKLTGSDWLDGTAVGKVAADPLFNLGWLLRTPWLCIALTYAALAWMSTFPLAVWWRGTRRWWLFLGVVFHLCTAVFMGIPQMGLVFIACYALWLDEREADRVISWLRLFRPAQRSPAIS